MSCIKQDIHPETKGSRIQIKSKQIDPENADSAQAHSTPEQTSFSLLFKVSMNP